MKTLRPHPSNRAVTLRRLLLIGILALLGNAQAAQTAVRPLPSLLHKKGVVLHLPRLTPPQATQPGAKPGGPNPTEQYGLIDMGADEDLIAGLQDAVGWKPHELYQDKNISTLFYYVPQELRLTFDEGRYGIQIQYNSLEDIEDAVLVVMKLRAPYHNGDVKLLRELLKSVLHDSRIEVRALPALDTQTDLEAFAAKLGVKPEQISLAAPSNLRETYELTIHMSPDQVEALLAQMNSAGMAQPLTIPLGEHSISLDLMLAFDRFSGSYLQGLSAWRRGRTVDRLGNASPFPVHITGVSAVVKQGGRLTLKSRPLKKPVTLAPGQKKPFRLPSPGKIFGSGLQMVWLDTGLDTDCAHCRARIDKEIRSGIALPPLKKVRFEAIPSVFERADLYKLIVEVRSPYFTAGRNRTITKNLELSPEQAAAPVRLYDPGRKTNKLFEYRLQAIGMDGQVTEEDQWHAVGTDRNLIPIGRRQLQALPWPAEVTDDETGQRRTPDQRAEPGIPQEGTGRDTQDEVERTP